MGLHSRVLAMIFVSYLSLLFHSACAQITSSNEENRTSNTKYDVKVKAINDEGFGPKSNISVTYSSFNATALNVTWDAVDQNSIRIRGKLIGYRVRNFEAFDSF